MRTPKPSKTTRKPKTAREPRPVNFEWFSRRLEEREISQRKLGTLMNLDGSAVNGLLHGRRNARAEEVSQLANILGLPISDVLENLGAENTVLGTTVSIAARWDDSSELTPKDARQRSQVAVPLDLPRGVVAARNEDPSSLRYGWVLYYVPATSVLPDALGRAAICTLDDGRVVCGFARPGFKAGEHTVVLCSGSTIEGAKLKAATPILWIKVG